MEQNFFNELLEEVKVENETMAKAKEAEYIELLLAAKNWLIENFRDKFKSIVRANEIGFGEEFFLFTKEEYKKWEEITKGIIAVQQNSILELGFEPVITSQNTGLSEEVIGATIKGSETASQDLLYVEEPDYFDLNSKEETRCCCNCGNECHCDKKEEKDDENFFTAKVSKFKKNEDGTEEVEEKEFDNFKDYLDFFLKKNNIPCIPLDRYGKWL